MLSMLIPSGAAPTWTARLLRAVDCRTFGDDSLRVLRALQLAARFELTIDDETRTLCRTIPLDDLPAERIWGEVEKLLSAPRPSIGLALALDLGVVPTAVSRAADTRGLRPGTRVAPRRRRVGTRLQVVRSGPGAGGRSAEAQTARRDASERCAHDFGKPSTTAFLDGRIR